jgi:tetratricopeptide (TPR) repeat protein
MCGFLAPDDIPRALPAEHARLLPDPLRKAAADPLTYDRIVNALARYSLVTATEYSLALHRLLQAWVRVGLDQQAQRRWAGVAVEMVRAAFPADSGDVQEWPTCARLLPHALAVTDHASSLAADPEATASLLNDVGGYLWWRAELGQARQLFEHALTILQATLGAGHPHVATSLNNLGNTLRGLGDMTAARDTLERAQALFEARLGADHPDTARCLNNLGNMSYRLGALLAARSYYERALAIFRTELGPDHPDAARTLKNLTTLLSESGDVTSSESRHSALPVFDPPIGSGNPIATTM